MPARGHSIDVLAYRWKESALGLEVFLEKAGSCLAEHTRLGQRIAKIKSLFEQVRFGIYQSRTQPILV